MEFASKYIGLAANRGSNLADIRPKDGLLAFASHNLIALSYPSDINSRGVHSTLPGHAAPITTLKFISRINDENSALLLSGDSTGVTRVWEEQSDATWKVTAVLQGHTQSVSALAALELPAISEEARVLILTGGSDGSAHSWIVTSSGSELVQKVDLKGKIPLEMALTHLPDSESIMLAIGSTTTRLQILTSLSDSTIFFRNSLSLEGHTDWIRSLAFLTPIPISSPSTSSTSSSPYTDYDISPGQVLLASGSQDNYIRLWRFARLSSSSSLASTGGGGLDKLDELERTLAKAEEDGGDIRVKSHDFTIEGDGVFACTSEAVLLGHDAWVTGLHWAPPPSSTKRNHNRKLQLLSASADRSLIIWTPTSDGETNNSSIWLSERRFGEFTSPTNLGFFGALWGEQGEMVLAHGWGGSWHVWRRRQSEEDDDDKMEEGGGEWDPVVASGGHFGKVTCLAWEPGGEFLLSTGSDMSTRLHGAWRRPSLVESGTTIETWHELGRPQIHGYPIASIAFTNRLQFVSGADEKIVRVFDAPRIFLTSLDKLSHVTGLGDEESRPMAANVPPLGLSNRAIASTDEADQLQPASSDPFDTVGAVNFSVASHPPLEEQLLGSTLWPETDKIYGHGYEIIALTAAYKSPLIATACKSTTAEHAAIRLYETKSWKQVGEPLKGHNLTITNLAFSSDDRFLLSVSRDRTWRLFERYNESYRPSATSSAHTRIIWDAAWAADDSFFVTVSRDKTAKVWVPTGETPWSCAATLKFNEAATAVASIGIVDSQRHLLAVGLENGQIHLFSSPAGNKQDSWHLLHIIDSRLGHTLTVTSLKFRPQSVHVKDGTVELASGSEDKSVRISVIQL